MAHAKASQILERQSAAPKLECCCFTTIDTGLATVGQVDSDGNYADLGNHHLDKNWVAVISSGQRLRGLQ